MSRLTEDEARRRARGALRERCRIVYQTLGRDAMLRQNDPVEALVAFALELLDEHSYVIGFNHGWEEALAKKTRRAALAEKDQPR